MDVVRPGGALATRPLHFIWIVDKSGSMSVDGKMQVLNRAIQETIPHMREVASDNPNAEVLVRVVAFSSSAIWHVSQPTPVSQFVWDDVKADGGLTALGAALNLVADQMKIPPMTERALPPVIVLLTDGQPTDNYALGLQALMNERWGEKAVRIAIGIGSNADFDVLQRFIGNPELQPLQAGNPEALVNHIKWASTAVLKAVSTPASQSSAAVPAGVNVPIPQPSVVPSNVDDVW